MTSVEHMPPEARIVVEWFGYLDMPPPPVYSNDMDPMQPSLYGLLETMKSRPDIFEKIDIGLVEAELLTRRRSIEQQQTFKIGDFRKFSENVHKAKILYECIHQRTAILEESLNKIGSEEMLTSFAKRQVVWQTKFNTFAKEIYTHYVDFVRKLEAHLQRTEAMKHALVTTLQTRQSLHQRPQTAAPSSLPQKQKIGARKVALGIGVPKRPTATKQQKVSLSESTVQPHQQPPWAQHQQQRQLLQHSPPTLPLSQEPLPFATNAGQQQEPLFPVGVSQKVQKSLSTPPRGPVPETESYGEEEVYNDPQEEYMDSLYDDSKEEMEDDMVREERGIEDGQVDVDDEEDEYGDDPGSEMLGDEDASGNDDFIGEEEEYSETQAQEELPGEEVENCGSGDSVGEEDVARPSTFNV